MATAARINRPDSVYAMYSANLGKPEPKPRSTVSGTGYMDFGDKRTALVGGKMIDVADDFVPDEAYVQDLINQDRTKPVSQRETMPAIGLPSYDELYDIPGPGRSSQDLRRESAAIQSATRSGDLDYTQGMGPLKRDEELYELLGARRGRLDEAAGQSEMRESAGLYDGLGKGATLAMRLAADREKEAGLMHRARLGMEKASAGNQTRQGIAANASLLPIIQKELYDALSTKTAMENSGDVETQRMAAGYDDHIAQLKADFEAAKSGIMAKPEPGYYAGQHAAYYDGPPTPNPMDNMDDNDRADFDQAVAAVMNEDKVDRAEAERIVLEAERASKARRGI